MVTCEVVGEHRVRREELGHRAPAKVQRLAADELVAVVVVVVRDGAARQRGAGDGGSRAEERARRRAEREPHHRDCAGERAKLEIVFACRSSRRRTPATVEAKELSTL